MGIGDWGLGIGGWGFWVVGVGGGAKPPTPQPTHPTPQTPNPQSPLFIIKMWLMYIYNNKK